MIYTGGWRYIITNTVILYKDLSFVDFRSHDGSWSHGYQAMHLNLVTPIKININIFTTWTKIDNTDKNENVIGKLEEEGKEEEWRELKI